MSRFQPEDLKDEPLAKSGVLVRVTVKPGLPQGPIRQKLVVQTNLASPAELTLPIQGTVGSEIGDRRDAAGTPTPARCTLGAIRSSVGLQTTAAAGGARSASQGSDVHARRRAPAC